MVGKFFSDCAYLLDSILVGNKDRDVVILVFSSFIGQL